MSSTFPETGERTPPLRKARRRRKPARTIGWRNFKTSPVTTILGLALVVASIATPLLKDSASWADACEGVLAGVMLMLSPDTLVRKARAVLRA